MEDKKIVHNEAESRYELQLEDDVVSVAEYRRDGDRLIFNHTATDPRFQGKGLAAEVVRYALDDVRDRGLSVVPACWFVADFIESNPDYRPLLAA